VAYANVTFAIPPAPDFERVFVNSSQAVLAWQLVLVDPTHGAIVISLPVTAEVNAKILVVNLSSYTDQITVNGSALDVAFGAMLCNWNGSRWVGSFI
jgi:hypothetical protein